MKTSPIGKIVICITLAFGIGFILGQKNIEKAVNIDGIMEAHLDGIRSTYLKGCTENNNSTTPESFQECVRKAKLEEKEQRSIIEQNPMEVQVPQRKNSVQQFNHELKLEMNQEELRQYLNNSQQIMI